MIKKVDHSYYSRDYESESKVTMREQRALEVRGRVGGCGGSREEAPLGSGGGLANTTCTFFNVIPSGSCLSLVRACSADTPDVRAHALLLSSPLRIS